MSPSQVVRLVPIVLALSGCGAGGVAPTSPRPEAPRIETTPRSLVALPAGRPLASFDLGDDEAAGTFSTSWRVIEVVIDEALGVELGEDGRPTPSESARTYAIRPRPREPGWEEAAWQAIAPHALGARRGHGQLAMGWSRARIRIPEHVGALSLAHTRLELSLTVDDYAEVWVDGQLRPRLGQVGGGVVGGWNAPGRVLLTADARPGAEIEIAILAINGPISRGPENFHFVREAVLDVHAGNATHGEPAVIERRSPSLDAIVPSAARVEVVAVGFDELGSMLWDAREHALLLADVEADTIHRFDPADGSLTLVRAHAGDARGGRSRVGPSGLALDAEGRLLVCERGRARVTRTEPTLALTEIVPVRAGQVPEDALVAPDASLWLVRDEEGGASLSRLEVGGALREVAMPAERAGDLALAPDGTRVLATLGAGTRVVSYALTGADAQRWLEVPREDAPLRDLVAHDGTMLLAGARGLLVTDTNGTLLGVVLTPAPTYAVAIAEGVPYVSTGRALVRLVRAVAP